MRVTMMSVPTEDRGESTLFWAWVSPSETPTMPITSPTPAARPMAVTDRAAPSPAQFVPGVPNREHRHLRCSLTTARMVRSKPGKSL